MLRRPDKTQSDIAGQGRLVCRRNGGADRDRTDDLVIANDALSQLSYGPTGALFVGFRMRCQAARRPLCGA